MPIGLDPSTQAPHHGRSKSSTFRRAASDTHPRASTVLFKNPASQASTIKLLALLATSPRLACRLYDVGAFAFACRVVSSGLCSCSAISSSNTDITGVNFERNTLSPASHQTSYPLLHPTASCQTAANPTKRTHFAFGF
ncbi:unnamed protein product [Protopolystoma xenopodis]|uniref:Uncharacterized protein n=1 Tax=Protopolystoma xenopodis TaxID=117903 RepID=A0A3S5BAH0_9PLAT|nr:unnamed protein product [Protopolystoma xenopodis]